MADKWAPLSRRLYDVLEHVGASEHARHMHRITSTTGEIMDTIKQAGETGKTGRFYRCGSSFESSVTPATSSDIDIVYGMTSMFPLVAEVDRAPGSLALHMARSERTFPGYVKLRLLLDGRYMTSADRDSLDWFELDADEHFCFKHLKTGDRAVANGPADALYDKYGKHVYDTVFSFKCDEIPTFLRSEMDFTTSKESSLRLVVPELTNFGCMVVGVGYADSEERGIEWRLSFTLQERQLMSSLTPVQHKVYILLKIIKEEFLNKVAVNEKFSSYHFKTCVLYASLISSAQAWTRDNLIGCLLSCLSILLKMVTQKSCPNIFVRDQNLFAKKGFRTQREQVATLLRSMLHDLPSYLVQIQTEQIGQRLSDSGVKLNTRLNNDVAFFNFQFREVTTIMYCRKTILQNTHPTELQMLFADMDDFRKSALFADKAVDAMERANTHMSSFLHLYCAIKLAGEALKQKQEATTDYYDLLKKCERHLQAAQKADLVSSWLIRATLLLHLQKYEECLDLLRQIEDRCAGRSTRVVSEDTGSNAAIATNTRQDNRRSDAIADTNAREENHHSNATLETCSRDENSRSNATPEIVGFLPVCCCMGNPQSDKPIPEHIWSKLSGLSVETLLQNHVASCLAFRPTESAIVPLPLRFEMFRSIGTPPASRNPETHFWYDWAVVDAKVYLYLLMYLASSRSDRRLARHTAVTRMRKLVSSDEKMGHRDTALNLLGWMYVQEGMLIEGLRCFSESWKLRPRHNASKLHVYCVWDKMKALGRL